MTKLVDFDEHKNEHDVHDGGVKLQADVAGTCMENCTEKPLEDHTEAHTIEQAVLLRQS